MLTTHKTETIPTHPRPIPDGTLYFVGVGGAGMSALAQVLAERGRRIVGSDPGISPAVKARLEAAGVTVFTAHDAAQVGEDVAAVIVSDAIPDANPEVRLAREQHLPIIRRPELLGALMSEGRGIAIAGTHGKTTTTGMVASILMAAGLDPTILIGGDLPLIGGNARAGKGDIILAEACEAYDGFLYLHPEIAVILNIEADHLDYHGSEEHMIASFERFLRQVKGTKVSGIKRYRMPHVFFCAEDEKAYAAYNAFRAYCRTQEWHGDLHPQPLTWCYGIEDSDVQAMKYLAALDITSQGQETHFEAWFDTDYDIPIKLRVPGIHNVLNALAAISVARALEVDEQAIISGLESFTGTGRRFEKLGEEDGVLIIDDYAHHPTEIRATLAAARSAYPDRRLVAVFQPHLPSRTRDLMDEFAAALAEGADAAYVTDIYLAREQPLPGVTSQVLAERIRALKPDLPVAHVADKSDLPARLAADVRPGDLVLVMGAGDIRAAGTGLLKVLAERPALTPPPLRGTLSQ